MITITGKNDISATMVLDSVSQDNIRLVTFELIYPRIIHAELMTHRMFSRNAASSRAIPFAKMQEQLTAVPVRFGAANKGMQDTGIDGDFIVKGEYVYNTWTGEEEQENLKPEHAWDRAKESAVFWSTAFHDAGYHKQIYNRLTEPFQMIKTIVTATEMYNFFWLRNDGAADPSLQELARVMFETYNTSVPTLLKSGEWHLPYVKTQYDRNGKLEYIIDDGVNFELELSLEDAIKVSSARTAAVSFRNTDYDLEKSKIVYDRLVGDERKHSSALEHQSTPMQIKYGVDYNINCPSFSDTWEKGISHMDRDNNLWSANFKGWIQHRKLIDGENHNQG